MDNIIDIIYTSLYVTVYKTPKPIRRNMEKENNRTLGQNVTDNFRKRPARFCGHI